MFATLKQTHKIIFEPRVTIAEIIRFNNRLMLKRLYTKRPRSAVKILIKTSIITVFRKSRFASFLFISIEIFIEHEIRAIRK